MTEQQQIYNTTYAIQNNCSGGQLFTYRSKAKKYTSNVHVHQFHIHKMCRQFIADLFPLSNLHSCGLYNYCALLSYAVSFSNRTHKTECYAWIEKNFRFYTNIFGYKSIDQCIRALEQLKNFGLINFFVNFKKKKITVHVLSGNTEETHKNNKRAEFAAINNREGFVFVNEINLMKLLDAAQTYSERDIAVDLWLHTLFQDNDVFWSHSASIVVFDRYLLNSASTYTYMKTRWNCSSGRVHKVLKKFEEYRLFVYRYSRRGTYIFNPNFAKYLWNSYTEIPTDKELKIYWLILMGKVSSVNAETAVIKTPSLRSRHNKMVNMVHEVIEKRKQKNVLNYAIYSRYNDSSFKKPFFLRTFLRSLFEPSKKRKRCLKTLQ